MMNLEKPSEIQSKEFPIIVVGAGGTGLASALTIAEKGIKVLLIEKRKVAGGNTAMARGIFAVESPVQKRLKIDARKEDLFKKAMSYAHWKIDPNILRTFIERSGDTIRWLEEKGLKFEDVLHYYPNQIPRVFHVPEGRGAGLVKFLLKQCQNMGVEILYETRAKRILLNEKGEVCGIVAVYKDQEIKISAKSVIIGTGGYGGNRELLKKYYPDYTEDLCLHGVPNMGDGLLMAMEIGAATEGLGILHLRGPRFPTSSYLSVVIEEPNTLWLNKKGERFVDEAISFNWPEAGNALNQQPDKISYTLFDEKIKTFFIEKGLIKGTAQFPSGTRMKELEKELLYNEKNDSMKISMSWEEMSRWMGIPFEVLQKSIKEYNNFCDQGFDERFGKDRRYLMPIRTLPFYGFRCVQSFHGTIGGIKINHRMEVLNQEHRPIAGLYAGGIDTGGWESETYCLTLSGSAFGFAINSGRIAGENAVNYILNLH